MKLSEKDYLKLLEVVEDSISWSANIFGIGFEVIEIRLYGSQLSEKISPGDIDVFVQVGDIEIISKRSFREAYGKGSTSMTEQDLVEIMHEHLHEDQPSFKGLPVDINFKAYEFDLDCAFILLK